MVTFRDLVPRQSPQDELAMPRSARITGETVAEAVARGVKIEYLPILRRDIDPGPQPPGCNYGAVSSRGRVRSQPRVRAVDGQQRG